MCLAISDLSFKICRGSMPPDPLADLNLGAGSILILFYHANRFVVKYSTSPPSIYVLPPLT